VSKITQNVLNVLGGLGFPDFKPDIMR